jgi:hypothetical protein
VTSSTGKKRSRLQRADDSDEEGPAAGDEAAAENQEVSGETGAVGRGRTGAGCVQHYMSSGVPGPPPGLIICHVGYLELATASTR